MHTNKIFKQHTALMKPLTLEEAKKSLQHIGLSLRAYQLDGIKTIIEWHEHGHGGILADEMGLGKTCQAIVSVAILCSENSKSHVLVICPLSVIDHWEYEIARFSCGRLQAIRYYGAKEKRAEMRKTVLRNASWNLLLTTFETYLNDATLLKYTWDALLFDEAHRVKNDISLLHKAVENSDIRWKLLMTGTPIQNKLLELYALLKLVDEAKFPEDGATKFMEKYGQMKSDENVATEFRALFAEYCLRRNKKILKEVPKCSEVVLFHEITSLQYDIYRAILQNNRRYFKEVTGSAKCARQSLMSVLVQLRKCCNHPYLFAGIEPQPFEEGEHLITSSGKTLILERLLEYLLKRGHRVLIFSQFVRFLNIVADCLTFKGYVFEQLDGSNNSEERLRSVENFQRPGSNVFAFLLSTKAGGLGLNLTAADTVIFLDWDFNPQNDKQAAARCHRIGQEKPVKLIRLIAKHTLEEMIKYRAIQKLKLSEMVLGTDEHDGPTSQVDLANMLLEGLKDLEQDQRRDRPKSHKLTDEQLEEKIGKTAKNGLWELAEEEKTTSPAADEEEGEEENAIKSIYDFEGRNYLQDRQALDSLLQQQNDVDLLKRVGHVSPVADGGSPNERRKVRGRAPALTEEELAELRRQRREKELLRKERLAEEKAERKRALWEAKNYQSMNLPLPENNVETGKKTGSIYNVRGDLTQPERAPTDRSTGAIILQTVDDGGHFGVGGLFSVLRTLSDRIPAQYELAAAMEDLHRGDSHLVDGVAEQPESKALEELTDPDAKEQDTPVARSVSVVLMVVQSERDRYTKCISLTSLEQCLRRVQRFALESGATSVHLPQIWFGFQNLDEQRTRSLLARHLSSQGIDVYIYAYRRPDGRGEVVRRPFKPRHLNAMRQQQKRRSVSPPPFVQRSTKRARPCNSAELDEDDMEATAGVNISEDEEEYLPEGSEEESDVENEEDWRNEDDNEEQSE